MYNLCQYDFDPLADHIYAEIMIIRAISLDFSRRQNDAIVKLVRYSLE